MLYSVTEKYTLSKDTGYIYNTTKYKMHRNKCSKGVCDLCKGNDSTFLKNIKELPNTWSD